MDHHKRDFAVDYRLWRIAAIAVCIGALSTLAAYWLLGLIHFFTNLFFFQKLSFAYTSPAGNHLGLLVIVVPVIGGLIVGLMARYGSEKIRGHGIPEALEAILFKKSKIQPKVAVLKPLSAGIAIGSGGPFGAEGPIIMTGGALGSLIAQNFHLTAGERKTLLVAGAAAGMAAVFNTPLAALLLALELLLFEWRPRSLLPVALACAVAGFLRPFLLDTGPLFPIQTGVTHLSSLPSCVMAGLLCGFLAAALSSAVYKVEDIFSKTPIPWVWWPAIGGLVVGISGYFEPRAFGVGYDVISDLLNNRIVLMSALGLLAAKGIAWVIALGSGTSGGVLAPLLTMGAGLGVLLAPVLPGTDAQVWPLVCMAAVLASMIGSPLTAIVFALELSHDTNAILPLLLTVTVSYGLTALIMKRSILTEKIARRGLHVYREYSVSPLERTHVEEVMTRTVHTIPCDSSLRTAKRIYFGSRQAFRGYPVTTPDNRLLGILLRDDLSRFTEDDLDTTTVGELFDERPIVALPQETCHAIASRMARHRLERLAVVSDMATLRLVGLVSRSDLITPAHSIFEEEEKRERLIGL